MQIYGTHSETLFARYHANFHTPTCLYWDPCCNFSLSVAILSVRGIYFIHLRVLGSDKLRAGQWQLMAQLGWYHLMPGNYSEREGKQMFPDENF